MQGHVSGGVVVFATDEPPAEGTRVRVVTIEDAVNESVAEVLRRSGLIGCLVGEPGSPRDLSTNPDHMEGFGHDAPVGDRRYRADRRHPAGHRGSCPGCHRSSTTGGIRHQSRESPRIATCEPRNTRYTVLGRPSDFISSNGRQSDASRSHPIGMVSKSRGRSNREKARGHAPGDDGAGLHPQSRHCRCDVPVIGSVWRGR